MAPPVHSLKCWAGYGLLSVLLLGLPLIAGGKKSGSMKALPSYLQKAYVIQKKAFVYARADFDSLKITQIPAGTLITISKKVYKPKTLFGTFYRVYLAKPKKIRAYISEIDVEPRLVRQGGRYRKNPAFGQAKKRLSRIRDFEVNSVTSQDDLNWENRSLSDLRMVGMTAGFARLAYPKPATSVSAWFFALKLKGKKLPLPWLATHFTLSFTPAPPVISQYQFSNGFVVLGDVLLRLSLLESSDLLFYLSGGFMAKWKKALAPPVDSPPTRHQMGLGLVGELGGAFRLYHRWILVLENRLYYDLSEARFFPLWFGGVLLSF